MDLGKRETPLLQDFLPGLLSKTKEDIYSCLSVIHRNGHFFYQQWKQLTIDGEVAEGCIECCRRYDSAIDGNALDGLGLWLLYMLANQSSEISKDAILNRLANRGNTEMLLRVALTNDKSYSTCFQLLRLIVVNDKYDGGRGRITAAKFSVICDTLLSFVDQLPLPVKHVNFRGLLDLLIGAIDYSPLSSFSSSSSLASLSIPGNGTSNDTGIGTDTGKNTQAFPPTPASSSISPPLPPNRPTSLRLSMTTSTTTIPQSTQNLSHYHRVLLTLSSIVNKVEVAYVASYPINRCLSVLLVYLEQASKIIGGEIEEYDRKLWCSIVKIVCEVLSGLYLIF
jgi:hypothetical protein